MAIVRTQSRSGRSGLAIFNSMRLSERELASLESLGEIKHVVRLGSFHGVDDAFYVQRYGATHWGVDGMTPAPGMAVETASLSEDRHERQPVSGARAFVFRGVPHPEAIYVLPPNAERPGVAISTDSLQNHDTVGNRDNSIAVSLGISRIGLKGAARLGPIWLREQAPRKEPRQPGLSRNDQIAQFFRPQLTRLIRDYEFDALAPGHGAPLRCGAKVAIRASMEVQLGPSKDSGQLANSNTEPDILP